MKKRIVSTVNDNCDVKFVDIIQAQRITNLGRTKVDEIARKNNARHKIGARVLYELDPLLQAIREM